MKKKVILLILILIIANYAQPKKELRGVWVASLGIDWPVTAGAKGTTTTAIANQKAELISILDKHKKAGINTIFFHIRPECDAIYKSKLEPWSRYVTGTQGAAFVDTTYDPLSFAIEEAHKRGIELHAWMNPYRAMLTSGNTANLSANHIINKQPNWIIKCSTEYRFLDPGLPEVRNYVIKVVMDVIKRYNIDGIHFDDYFYPYADYGTYNDDATFNNHKYGFTDKSLWRINNVNIFLKDLHDSIKAVKSYIKYGVSPAGNPGNLAVIGCSPVDWTNGTYVDTLGNKKTVKPYIDYILPQLYWAISSYFGQFLPSWIANNSWPSPWTGRYINIKDVDLYIGHSATLAKDETSKQISLVRATYDAKGSVWFSSKSITGNTNNLADTMGSKYYKYPAIVPQLASLDTAKAGVVTNIKIGLIAQEGKDGLLWDKNPNANKYVVYKFNSKTPTALDFSNPANIVNITYNNYSLVPSTSLASNEMYYVTSLTRNNVETVPYTAPKSAPIAIYPVNNDLYQRDTITLRWRKAVDATNYNILIATDNQFTKVVKSIARIYDTTCVVNGFSGLQKYFWKIQSANDVGTSNYSNASCFTTAYPSTITAMSPANATLNVSVPTKLCWATILGKTKYNVILGTSNPIISPILDTTLTNDTTVTIKNLISNKVYYWKIKATNEYGSGNWSSVIGFKTATVNIDNTMNTVKTYSLDQNYPNPFNPTTKIQFSLKNAGLATLKVYNMIGQEIAELVNNNLDVGIYNVNFDASKLSSGIYFYKLTSGSFSQVRKMMVIK